MSMPSPRCAVALALAISGVIPAGTRPVSAADLLPPPPPVPVEIGSGWYLRVDFTESDYARPKDATRPDPGLPPLVNRQLSPEPGYGGGVGYRLTPWLRVDATLDQRAPSRFRAYSSSTNFVTGFNVEAGRLDVLTGLVNVYADLGTWWGLTPYLGAGIGFADKGFGNAYTQTTCTLAACDGNAGTGPRTPARRASHVSTSLAWALTGGVSYAVGAGVSLDASYRYVDLGSARTGLDDYGFNTRLKDLSANEVRVGLRYSFAGGLPLPTSLPFTLSSGNPYE